jgi:hypothetical protein
MVVSAVHSACRVDMSHFDSGALQSLNRLSFSLPFCLVSHANDCSYLRSNEYIAALRLSPVSFIYFFRLILLVTFIYICSLKYNYLLEKQREVFRYCGKGVPIVEEESNGDLWSCVLSSCHRKTMPFSHIFAIF